MSDMTDHIARARKLCGCNACKAHPDCVSANWRGTCLAAVILAELVRAPKKPEARGEEVLLKGDGWNGAVHSSGAFIRRLAPSEFYPYARWAWFPVGTESCIDFARSEAEAKRLALQPTAAGEKP